MTFIFLILILLFLGRNAVKTLKSRKRYALIAAILFILIIGLRCVQTGQDTEMYGAIFNGLFSYHSFFSFLADSSFENSIEYGYATWQWLIHYLFDYRGFLLLNATLIIVPFAYVVYKWSDDYRVSFVLYILLGFLSWDMCAARQAPAVSLTVLAYYFYCHTMYKKAIVSFLVAISFHTTALIFLPFVWALRFIKNDKILICCLIASKIIGSVFIAVVLPYMRIDYTDDVLGNSVGQVTYFGFLVMLLYILFIKRNRKIELPDTFYMFSYMMILWPLVDSLPAAFRITFYFMVYFCFALPSILRTLKMTNSKSVARTLIVLCFFIVSVYFYSNHYVNLSRHVYPYYTVFEYPDGEAAPLLYNY